MYESGHTIPKLDRAKTDSRAIEREEQPVAAERENG